MTTSLAPRTTREFTDRSEAMAEFLKAAGQAPRLLPPDDGAGCPLFHALAALQWTGETGLVQGSARVACRWPTARLDVCGVGAHQRGLARSAFSIQLFSPETRRPAWSPRRAVAGTVTWSRRIAPSFFWNGPPVVLIGSR